MSIPEELHKRVDELACELVHKDSTPFLVVMERHSYVEMMNDPDAPRWVIFQERKPFPYRFSGAYICNLPIRVEPGGSWVGNRSEPYPLVMSQVTAQVCFSGEYG